MVRHLFTRGRTNRRGRAAAAAVAVLSVAVATVVATPPAQADPPANDTPETATAITELPFTGQVDTTEATPDPGMGRGRFHSVWYSLQLARDGRVLVSLRGSSFEPQNLQMFLPESGTQDPTDWPTVARDSYGSVRHPAGLVTEVEGGAKYYLMVGTNRDGTGGPATLTIRRPARIAYTLDRFGTLDRVDGSAVLHGTIQATRPARVDMSVSVRQRVGDRVVRAEVWKSFNVTRKAAEWRMRFSAGRSFRAGPIRVYNDTLRVYDDGLFVMNRWFVRDTVTLR